VNNHILKIGKGKRGGRKYRAIRKAELKNTPNLELSPHCILVLEGKMRIQTQEGLNFAVPEAEQELV